MRDVTASQAEALRIVRVFPVTVERLYQALVTEAEVAAWLHPGSLQCAECRWPALAGASWRLVMVNAEGKRFSVGGRVLEVAANRRLVFTWVWEEGEFAGIETTVTASVGTHAGGAELTLLHEGLPNAAARQAHDGGWNLTLENLAGRLAA